MQTLAKYLLVIVSVARSAMDFQNHEAKEDAAALQLDGFFDYPKEINTTSSDQPFIRGYGFSFFPITTIAAHDLFGGAEFSLMPRQFKDQASTMNGEFLQSYGLGLGYQVIHLESQEGFAYGMIGINGDMRDVGSNNIYGDLSYTHQITFSKRLMLGGGFDIHYYFEDYFPYPVILLDWQVARHTKVKINFDNGEIKQFLSEDLNVSFGAQYDIFHYGFGRQKGYVMESTSSMLRMEYRLGENVYTRISAKKPFWGGEKVWLKSGKEIETQSNQGLSIRLQLVYGE